MSQFWGNTATTTVSDVLMKTPVGLNGTETTIVPSWTVQSTTYPSPGASMRHCCRLKSASASCACTEGTLLLATFNVNAACRSAASDCCWAASAPATPATACC